MAEILQMEPVVLIDKSKNKEAHIIVSHHHSFRDLLDSARRINKNVFEGNWDLTYLNPNTKQNEPIEEDCFLGDYLAQDVNTFYWNHKQSSFRVPLKNDQKQTIQINYNYNSPPSTATYTNPYQSTLTGTVMHVPQNQPTPPPTSYRMIQYAGFWKRFAAFMIDSAILGFMMNLVGVENGSWLFFGWLYAAVLESSKYQATFGKMAMGLKVTDMNGEKLNFGRATGRYFSKLLSYVTMMIGFVLAGLTEKKQALHDIVAQTLVVESSAVTAQQIPQNMQRQLR